MDGMSFFRMIPNIRDTNPNFKILGGKLSIEFNKKKMKDIIAHFFTH
jgi:hypothetical protein